VTYLALLAVGCWVIVFGTHELGHYLAFRIFGQNPPVRITWFGARVGNEVNCFSLSPKQLFIVDLAGILSGWAALAILFQGAEANFVYLVICSGDFVQMIACVDLHKHDKASVLGALKKQIAKAEKEMRKK